MGEFAIFLMKLFASLLALFLSTASSSGLVVMLSDLAPGANGLLVDSHGGC